MNGTIPYRWFNEIGKTQRPSITQDSGGGVVNTYADYLANVPMRLNIPKGGWAIVKARETGFLTVKFYLPTNPVPDIRPKDRIVLNSTVYDVSAIRNPDLAGGYLILDATTAYPSAPVN